MALKIKHSRFFSGSSQLVLETDGVRWLAPDAVISYWRRFRFDQIDYILMSPDHRLSLQAGREYFTIPTRPDKPQHRELVLELLRRVRAASAAPAGPA